jgi:hypothetical protein
MADPVLRLDLAPLHSGPDWLSVLQTWFGEAAIMCWLGPNRELVLPAREKRI